MPDMDSFDRLVSAVSKIEKSSAKIEASWKAIEKNSKKSFGKTPGGDTGGGEGSGSGRKFDTSKAVTAGKENKSGFLFNRNKHSQQDYRENPELRRLASQNFFGDSPIEQPSNALKQQLADNRAKLGTGVGAGKSQADMKIGAASEGGVGGGPSAAVSAPEDTAFKSPMLGISDVVGLLKNTSNAMGSFLPNIQQTMNRTSRYYSATLYGGNQMGRNQVSDATLKAMQGLGGITSLGSDAAVAEYLAASGMPVSSDTGSTYQTTLRTVANAARYMNISNENAVRSVEGMTNAGGASNLLRQLGIYTADLNTGQEKSQTQIFEEIAQRLTAGRGQASVEQTQKSIRRGALGVTIGNIFGGDTTTASLFKQYMIQRAAAGGDTSKYMNLAMDQSSVGRAGAGATTDVALGSAGNKNPLQASIDLTTTQTAAMNKAGDVYVNGIQAATQGLIGLTQVSGELAKSLGSAAAMVQTVFGNEQAKGIVSGLSGVLDFTTKGLGTIMSDVNGFNMFNAAGNLTQMALTGALMGGGLMAATSVAANAGNASYNTSSIGSASNYFKWGGGGEKAPLITRPSNGVYRPTYGSGGGSSAANLVAKYNSALGGGTAGTTSSTDAATTPTASDAGMSGSGGKLFNLDYLNAYRVTTHLGDVDGEHGKGHDGTDYGMSVGTDVKAVADGVVKAAEASNPSGGLGFYVQIVHTASNGQKYNSVYGHLSQVMVRTGDRVSRGQVIGKSGNTGFSTGPHLHFEINKGENRTGGYYDGNVNMQLSDMANVAGNGAGLGGSAYADASSSDGSAALMGAMQTYAQIPNAAGAAYGILQNLYSGNATQIGSAISALGSSVSIPQSVMAQYLNASGTTAAAGLSSAAGAAVAAQGGKATTVGNTVNITVSVPDVTSSEALKFAQLVQGYLNSNSLASNMGTS